MSTVNIIQVILLAVAAVAITCALTFTDKSLWLGIVAAFAGVWAAIIPVFDRSQQE